MFDGLEEIWSRVQNNSYHFFPEQGADKGIEYRQELESPLLFFLETMEAFVMADGLLLRILK